MAAHHPYFFIKQKNTRVAPYHSVSGRKGGNVRLLASYRLFYDDTAHSKKIALIKMI